MTTTVLTTANASPIAASRRRTAVYWIVSLPVLLETAAGIQWDFARNPTVVDALETIRFPDYMADVLGVAKILALLAILPPGMARAKEWAYAGLCFVYFGASACHVAVGDGLGATLTPVVLGVITLASGALRPASRRDRSRCPRHFAPCSLLERASLVGRRHDDRRPHVPRSGRPPARNVTAVDLPDDVVEALMAAGAEHLTFNAPLSPARARSLVDALAERPARSIVDLGCGKGELARLAAHRCPQAAIVGVDLSQTIIDRAAAETTAAGLADRVRFEVGDAAQWPGPVDAALCVASSHALGGSVEMLTRIGQMVPAGMAVIGEGVWVTEPDSWCVDTFGSLPRGPEALVAEASSAGWTVIEADSSTLAEWDAFEGGWVAGVRAVGTAEARAFAAEREAEYARYRGVLGFSWLILER